MSFEKIKSLILSIIVMCAVWLSVVGCAGPKIEQDDLGDEQNVSFVVKLRNSATDVDNTIERLRMLVFNADTKAMLLNSVVNPEDAYQSVEDSYLMSATLKGVRAVRYFVIANEPTSWNLDAGVTYDKLKSLEINYTDVVSGMSDVNPPFLMMASHNDEVATPSGSEVEQEAELVRNTVKVTLTLRQPLGADGEVPLTIKKIFIGSVPEKGFLFQPVAYSEGYINTPECDLSTTAFVKDGEFFVMNEAQTFYIPENILSDKANYTRIFIDAERKGSGKQVQFEIVLGAGAGRLYTEENRATLADLTLSDLSIVRNTHFDIEATLGVELKTNFKVKEWTVKDITGSINIPYLNISSIKEWLDCESPVLNPETGEWYQNTIPEKLVFLFWTNVPKDEFKLDERMILGNDFGNPILISDLFDYTWTVTEQPNGFLPGVPALSARLELKFKDFLMQGYFLTRGTEFNVTAGPLKRNFTISLVTHST